MFRPYIYTCWHAPCNAHARAIIIYMHPSPTAPRPHHTTSPTTPPPHSRTSPAVTIMPCRALLRVRLCDSCMPAICGPPPFVFVSVIILSPSISKLMSSQKGIHLTLTKPTKHQNKYPTPTPKKKKPIHKIRPITLYTPRRAWYTWHVTYNSNPFTPNGAIGENSLTKNSPAKDPVG